MAEASRKRKQPTDGWEERGGYMNAKIQKLQEQYDQGEHLESGDGAQSGIFAGVTIHVNGYTDPSSDELKRLMHMHGGDYQHYYRKSKVTHTIATNLTDTKIKALKGELIVLPDWITQSIEAGKLLDVKPFLLYDQPTSQATIQFPYVVQEKPSLVSDCRGGSSIAEASLLECAPGPSVVAHSTPSVGEFEKSVIDSDRSHLVERSRHEWHDVQSDGDEEYDECDYGIDADYGPEKAFLGEASKGPVRPELSAGMGHKQLVKTSTYPALKAGESGFVSEFYGHSRLHHLSTWGTELRKFTSMLSDRPASQGLAWRRQHPVAGAVTRQRTIMHVDMDCFFVAISLRNFPEHVGKPVAVTHGSASRPASSSVAKGTTSPGARDVVSSVAESSHSSLLTQDNSRSHPVASASDVSAGKSSTTPSAAHSSADIASCSYEARAHGVHNGMWLTRAMQLCPDLVTVPYDFAAYRVASQSLYEVLTSFSRTIEAVSCDEAFIDVSKLVQTDGEAHQLAEDIRKAILKATGVAASAGIASNVLLARMATRLGKPNGQYLVTDEEVLEFVGKQDVEKLPGVGRSTARQLADLNIQTCAELRAMSSSVLQEHFGPKTGQTLWSFARGKDDRELRMSRERKSISAEINYGMRFKQKSDVEKFVDELSRELQQRMVSCNMKGKHLCLKMKVRKATAPKDSGKHMGHGICDNMTRSISLPAAISDAPAIKRYVWLLIDQMKVDYGDIRGMGIQMQRLVAEDKAGKSSVAPIQSFFSTTAKTSSATRNASLTVRDSRNSADSCFSPAKGDLSMAMKSGDFSDNKPNLKVGLVKPKAGDAIVTDSHSALVRGGSSKLGGGTLSPPAPPLPFLPTQSAYLQGQSTMSAASSTLELPGIDGNSSLSSVASAASDSRKSLAGNSTANLSTATTDTGIALPAHEDLDESVLAALPPEIRQDIEQAYRQQKKDAQGSSSVKDAADKLLHSDLCPSSSQVDMNVLAELPPALRAEVLYDNRQQLRRVSVSPRPAQQPRKPLAQSRSKYHIASTQERQMQLFAQPVVKKISAPAKTYALVAALKGYSDLPHIKKVLREWVESTNEPEAVDGLVIAKYLGELMINYNLQQAWVILQFFHRLVEKQSSWFCVFNAVLAHCQKEAQTKWSSTLPMESLSTNTTAC